MNDTTRDELVTEVIDIYAEPENFPREDASDHAEKILRLIDDAVATRDEEIVELLLSDRAKNASAHEMQELSAQGVIRNHTLAFYGMKAALDAIGLVEKAKEANDET